MATNRIKLVMDKIQRETRTGPKKIQKPHQGLTTSMNPVDQELMIVSQVYSFYQYSKSTHFVDSKIATGPTQQPVTENHRQNSPPSSEERVPISEQSQSENPQHQKASGSETKPSSGKQNYCLDSYFEICK
jgi:hypothetical protein